MLSTFPFSFYDSETVYRLLRNTCTSVEIRWYSFLEKWLRVTYINLLRRSFR